MGRPYTAATTTTSHNDDDDDDDGGGGGDGAEDPNAAKKAVEKAKQAAKKVKHGRSDPNSKAGMKKETLLAMTASKFDDFPTWYREVRFLPTAMRSMVWRFWACLWLQWLQRWCRWSASR